MVQWLESLAHRNGNRVLVVEKNGRIHSADISRENLESVDPDSVAEAIRAHFHERGLEVASPEVHERHGVPYPFQNDRADRTVRRRQVRR